MATHVKTIAQNIYTTGNTVSWQPGDTVQFENGQHTGSIYFQNVHGNAPLLTFYSNYEALNVIAYANTSVEKRSLALAFLATHWPGAVTFDINGANVDGNNQAQGINFHQCSNFVVMDFLGGRVHNTAQEGIKGNDDSFNMLALGLTVSNTGGSGLRLGLSTKGSQAQYWQANYTEDIIGAMFNYVHDTQEETIYIGNSDAHQRWWSTDAAYRNILHSQHFNRLALCAYNTTLRSGNDGIQVGGGLKVDIHDNLVLEVGLGTPDDSHNNLIQIGQGSTGQCYNNFVYDSAGVNGSCYQIQADGVLFWNNIGIGGGVGLFLLGDIDSANRSTFIFHNTLVDFNSDAIYFNKKNSQLEVKGYNNIFHKLNNPVGSVNQGGALAFDISGSSNLFTSGSASLAAYNFANYFRNAKDSQGTETDQQFIDRVKTIRLNMSIGSPGLGIGRRLDEFDPCLQFSHVNVVMNGTNASRPANGLVNIGAS